MNAKMNSGIRIVSETEKTAKSPKVISAKNPDQPILGISGNKVVPNAELWHRRAKSYEYVL